MLAVRVTIMIDSDISKKLRVRQAKMLQENKGSVSFSRVVNETLKRGLKK